MNSYDAADAATQHFWRVAASEPDALGMERDLIDSLEQLFERLERDDAGLPPEGEEDDPRPEPLCVYADVSMFDDEDFGDLGRTEPVEGCQEKPEYYMYLRSADPGDTRPGVVYYCPRHFASNLGYLCDRMSRRTPEMEIRCYIDRGELPPRAQIISWGRMSDLGL